MKVLHFFKTYFPETMGGIEQVIFQLAEGGRAHGIEADVLYLSKRGNAEGETLAHHKVHRAYENIHLASTGFSWRAISAFKELASQADIVHYHFPWPFMDMVHFMSGVKAPTVVSYHSDIVKQKSLLRLYSPLMNSFLGDVTAIVATSPNYLASSPVLQRFKEKVSVIPLGIDRTTYPHVDRARLEHWRTVVGEKFFLFVGALRYYKGLDFLLEAAKATGLPVVIVGGGSLENDYKERATKLGAVNVRFLGSLPDDDKVALLELSHAIVFPSHLRSEAFGITLLEGAMYGKPLISCEIGTGTSYANIHEETGLVIPPENVPALALAMQTLWENQDQSNKYGAEAKKRFDRMFTAESMVKSYVGLYRRLLDERAAKTTSVIKSR